MKLFDSHCHLDVEAFDLDRQAVLARARAAGIEGQLLPAIDCASWPRIAALCRQEVGLYPAYGLHPMYLDQHTDAHLEALPDWLRQHDAVAVGEFGLDYFVDGLDPMRQRFLFDRQLQIARELDLPVVLHARRAVEEVILALRRIGGLRGVVHSYSGSLEQAEQLFALGFCLGIGGPVTYPRANRLRQLVAQMPIEFLLLETDAPDQPDAQWRGRRNEPFRLDTIARCIAALRGVSVETLATATCANAQRLFALPAAAGTTP